MEKIKISEMTEAETLNESDYMTIVQSGSNKKVKMNKVLVGDIGSISCSGTAAVTTTEEVEIGSGTIEKAGTYIISASVPINYYGQEGRLLILKLKINGNDVWYGGGIINSNAFTLYTQIFKIVNIPENSNIKVTMFDETGKTYSCHVFNLEYIRLK